MKKTLIFAMLALLLGSFSLKANAQNDTYKKIENAVGGTSFKANAQERTTTNVVNVQKTDYNHLIKEYEEAVDECVSLYNELRTVDNGKKAKEFEPSLTKAENLKSQLEKAKPQLNRTQVDRFNKANQKLLQVYKLG